jgi:hypothetical protein|tara:strand:- start:21893 stop:22168 length:276 start_codon:yes stop_codon:yes gene_type:complete
MNDCIKTKTIIVEVQENGIIRNNKGRIIARFTDNIEFEGEHIVEEKMYSLKQIRLAFQAGARRGYCQRSIMSSIGATCEEPAEEDWIKEKL